MIRIWDGTKERYLEDSEWNDYTYDHVNYVLTLSKPDPKWNRDNELFEIMAIYDNAYDGSEITSLGHLEVRYEKDGY